MAASIRHAGTRTDLLYGAAEPRLSRSYCHILFCMTLWYDCVMSTESVAAPTETRLRVNENGRVVIPAEFRKALGIRAGDEIILSWKDEEIRITTMRKRIERAQRHVRKYVKPGVSMVDELIADRRREAARDE